MSGEEKKSLKRKGEDLTQLNYKELDTEDSKDVMFFIFIFNNKISRVHLLEQIKLN